jgi:hypothetical protein
VIRIAWVNSTWSLVCDKIQLRSDKVVVHTVTTAGPTPGRAPQRGRQTFKIYPSGDDSRSKLCHRRTGAGTRRNGGNSCRRPMGGHTCTKCIRPGGGFGPMGGHTCTKCVRPGAPAPERDRRQEPAPGQLWRLHSLTCTHFTLGFGDAVEGVGATR